MHPLHDYLARQLADKLAKRKIVVWYDHNAEFEPFITELKNAAVEKGGLLSITLAPDEQGRGTEALLAEYSGSLYEVRARVEPHVNGDAPEQVLIYLPRCVRDEKGSVLMELEMAGDTYTRPLKWVARQVLRRRYTDGVIDEMLKPERVTWQDLARAASDTAAAEPPSLLKMIFHDAGTSDAILAAWLAREIRDREIEAKEARPELIKLVRSRLGLELPADAGVTKLRSITLRYVLAGEFRSDLRSAAPPSLDGIPLPRTKDEETAMRSMAQRLRADYAAEYADVANSVERELGLSGARIRAEALGAIDTFAFEERELLAYCGVLIATGEFDKAIRLVSEREHSFWLERDVQRRAQWEACRRMAELGQIATVVKTELGDMANRTPDGWVSAYASPASEGPAAKGGWYRMDQAQRQLEAWVVTLDDDPEELALASVRHIYDETCHLMTLGFTKALQEANWTTNASMSQTRVFSDAVATRPKPVAYFVVDAMRYEMGVELGERLPRTAEVGIRPAISALPSITPIGMAALLPGASSSFSVVEQGGKLGARIDDVFLSDLAARRKFASARLPGLVDLTLDDLLSLSAARLAKKIEGAQVIVVRSQEIDQAGEGGFTLQARQVMGTVIDNLARAMRRLSTLGVEQAVVAADHGHLFYATERNASMRTDAPGGQTLDLHRRCWIGRGGTTPPGCVRVSASALGYPSDLDFIFPTGAGVIASGGDLAYHHGGPSLQELVIPVLTIRLKQPAKANPNEGRVTATELPYSITNRMFSVVFAGDMLSGEQIVRPLLIADGKQVGAAGMAIDAEFDRATGCIKLPAGVAVRVGFVLNDDSATSLRIVAQDPNTDAELYRSPSDIPIKLGM